MAVICKIRSLTDVVSTVETFGVTLRLWGCTSEGTINRLAIGSVALQPRACPILANQGVSGQSVYLRTRK
jgi:hypothetical protein